MCLQHVVASRAAPRCACDGRRAAESRHASLVRAGDADLGLDDRHQAAARIRPRVELLIPIVVTPASAASLITDRHLSAEDLVPPARLETARRACRWGFMSCTRLLGSESLSTSERTTFPRPTDHRAGGRRRHLVPMVARTRSPRDARAVERRVVQHAGPHGVDEGRTSRRRSCSGRIDGRIPARALGVLRTIWSRAAKKPWTVRTYRTDMFTFRFCLFRTVRVVTALVTAGTSSAAESLAVSRLVMAIRLPAPARPGDQLAGVGRRPRRR